MLQPPYFLANCDCGPKMGSKQRIPLDGYRVLEIRRHWVSSLWMRNKDIGTLSNLYFIPDNNQTFIFIPKHLKPGTTWVRKAPVRQAVRRRRRLGGVQLGRRGVTGHASTQRWRISWWTGHDGVWSMMAYGSSRPGCLPKKDLPANGELH